MSEPATSEVAELPRSAPETPWRIITPRRSMFDIPWRDLWRYRDLILMLARRDLTASYKQTALGPLWFVFQPVLVTAVFSYLFGRMAGFKTDIPHYLFYMSGLVIWGYFAECVNKTARTFTDNAHLFSKVYFPRLAVPIAAILTNLIPLLVQFSLFLIGFAFYVCRHDPFVHPNWTIVFVPLLILQVAMLGFGIGCIVCSLTRRYRDLVFGIQVGLQLWMFGSAIVFPISQIKDPFDRLLFFLNPVVPMIESFRYAFMGITLMQPWHLALSSALSLMAFAIGVLLFNRAEQTAMDTI